MVVTYGVGNFEACSLQQVFGSFCTDPDDGVRSSLLRTTRGPDAVNRQLAIVVVLGAAGLAGAAALRRPRPQPADSSLGAGLVRLGRATSIVAAALGLAGLAGIVILIADADSTLFLYTDRVVVAVIGLVVLVPTLARNHPAPSVSAHQ